MTTLLSSVVVDTLSWVLLCRISYPHTTCWKARCLMQQLSWVAVQISGRSDGHITSQPKSTTVDARYATTASLILSIPSSRCSLPLPNSNTSSRRWTSLDLNKVCSDGFVCSNEKKACIIGSLVACQPWGVYRIGHAS
jgi:hypothetical protein